MNSIYLLRVGWDYEGSYAIRAFKFRDAANALAATCAKYQMTKPSTPGIDDDEVAWDKWVQSNDAWLAAHPGGEDAGSADFFDVVEVDLDDTAPTHQPAPQTSGKEGDKA